MYQKLLAKLKTIHSKNRIIIAASVGVLVLIITAVILFMWPHRSVAAYCKVYKQQDAKLANAKGDTYALAAFSHSSSKASDFVSALTNLERVAPNDIRPDVTTLRKIFQTIDKDPAQAMSASLSGIGAESSVKDWTSQHCRS